MAKKEEEFEEFEEFEDGEDDEEDENGTTIPTEEQEEEEQEEEVVVAPIRKANGQFKKKVEKEVEKVVEKEVPEEEIPEEPKVQYVGVPRVVSMEEMMNKVFDDIQELKQMVNALLTK